MQPSFVRDWRAGAAAARRRVELSSACSACSAL